jgi:ribosome-binding protein aMBF1 (putative translation factor)
MKISDIFSKTVGYEYRCNSVGKEIDSEKAIAEARSRPGFTEAWDALEEEYAALGALLEARQKAGLTREALALKMGTTKSAVSRLESSRSQDSRSGDRGRDVHRAS